jgi:endonuclease G
MMKLPTRASAIAVLLLLATACTKTTEVTPASASGRDDNLALGNPSGAVASLSSPSNYLLVKDQYTLSYNRDQGKPNWVSWHLSDAWLGSAPRQDDFRADDDLPSGWYQVKATDYSGSGFDRGHNCPSADRTGSVAENYARSLVADGNELYLICGSYGKGGTGSAGYETTLAGGKITVPAHCWKVVVVVPGGKNGVSRINANTRVIAIDTPNDNSLSTNWGTYRTSVDAIEAATGYDLLSAVPTGLQNKLEAKADTGPTN